MTDETKTFVPVVYVDFPCKFLQFKVTTKTSAPRWSIGIIKSKAKKKV